MEFILKVLAVVGLSCLKYLLGVSMAVVALTPIEGFISVVIGSSISVFIYVFGGKALSQFFIDRKKKKLGEHYVRPKVFTKKNRFLVKIRKNGGLPLVAFLSPVIISLTVGCLLAITFVRDKRQIVAYMIASIFVWSLMIFGGLLSFLK
jgi:hypothetical protein